MFTELFFALLLLGGSLLLCGCSKPIEQVPDNKSRVRNDGFAEEPVIEPMPIHRVDRFQSDGWNNPEEPKTPMWIVQSADYLRNEMPLEFLRNVLSDKYSSDVSQREIYISLDRQQHTKRLVFLRTLSANEYGYSIYDDGNQAQPIRRGRFRDSTEGSFIWIDGRGADRKTFGTIGGEKFHEVTKIPGVDIDVVALDADSKDFVTRASAIKLRGYSRVTPKKAVMYNAGVPPQTSDFCKFYITNRGAPNGRVRHLDWSGLKSVDQ